MARRRISESVTGHNIFCTLSLRVVPGSSGDEIVGWVGEVLKLRVRAVAEKGKANANMVALLAKHLDVAASDIKIMSGKSGRLKIVRIAHLTEHQVRERLGRILSSELS